MTKFLHAKRDVFSVYSKSLKFYEKDSSKDLPLQRRALADVCSVDILIFQKIHRKASVPDSVFNEVTGLKPTALLQKRLQRRCFLVNFVEYLRTILIGRTLPGGYFWLFKYIKVDRNVSSYCNKDKVISI